MSRAKLRKAELLELLDSVACLFQNPDFYSLVLYQGASGPGKIYRDRVIAQLNEISPPPPHPVGAAGPTNDLKVPVGIMRKANGIMRHHSRSWPEDEWFNLSAEWDLHLSRSTLNAKRAHVYPVVGGHTLTSRYKSVR